MHLNSNTQLTISSNQISAPSSSSLSCNYWLWAELKILSILLNGTMLPSTVIWFFVEYKRSSISFDFCSNFEFNIRRFSPNSEIYSCPFWVDFLTCLHVPSFSWFTGTKAALPMSSISATSSVALISWLPPCVKNLLLFLLLPNLTSASA